MKGQLYSKEATTNTLEIDLSQGGKLYVDAGSNVKVQKVTFGSNKVISVGLAGADTETLVKAWNSKEAAVTGSFEVTDGQNGFDSVTTKNMASLFSSSSVKRLLATRRSTSRWKRTPT